MKLNVKVLLTTVLATVLFATPVFATETTLDKEMLYINNHVKEVGVQITEYLKTDDGCGAGAKVDHGTHATVVDSQLLKWIAEEEANYIGYLQKIVNNKKETERVKKEVADNYVNLAKINPQFAGLVPGALNEYNAAVADRMAAEAEVASAQAAFNAYNVQLNAVIAGGIANNTAMDK